MSAAVSPNTSGVHAAFPWYAGGTAAWFTAWGVVQLSVNWLLVGVLHESGSAVGNAQGALQLPSLVLLLFGGAIADRIDPRRILAAANLFALVPIAGLALGLAQGAVSHTSIVLFCLALGTASAFAAPARDALLSRLAGPDLMRAVAGLTLCQFGGQFLGSLAGGSLAEWSVLGALAAPAALFVFGALATARLPRPEPAGPHESALRSILAGLTTVARTPALRVPVGLVTAISVFFMGSFAVAFPLVVRDVYHGDSTELSFVQAVFPLGTIFGSIAILLRGGVKRKGRAMLLAMSNGALMLGLLSLALPFWAFLLGGLAWGTGGAVFINSSRALVLEAAPPEQRGRVLSVYQLGFVGSFPIGAWVTGQLCEAWGPLMTMRVFAVCMALVVASVAMFSSARKL